MRAFDLALEELFAETMCHLFPGNPLEHLDEYRRLTESSFLVDVSRLPKSDDPELKELGRRWEAVLNRQFSWKMAAERAVNFHSGRSERTTIFSEPDVIERRVRRLLPEDLREIELALDCARHYHRPSAALPAGGQNWLQPAGGGDPVELHDDELFRSLPRAFAVFRIYARTHEHDAAINAALNAVLGDAGDSVTNM